MKTIRLSRDELYQQVWEEPITTLAKRYGLSDVGLAKTCKRHNIPTPERGYWAKKAGGKAMPNQPLPDLTPGESYLSFIDIQIRPHIEFRNPHEVGAQIKYEKDIANQIIVPDTLNTPHSLISSTEKSLRAGKVNEIGICQPKKSACLDIQVTPGSLDRSLRIMDALVKAMEARGYKLHHEKAGAPISVRVNGEDLAFSLEERTLRADHVLTDKEKEKLAKRQVYRFQLPQHDYNPTGKLSLKIGGWYSSRATWADAKIQRVENCLNDFLAGLVITAAEKRATREERERKEREWQEAQRRRQEKVRLRKEEQARLDMLKKEAAGWHESQRIRQYINAVTQDAIARNGAIVPGSELERWLLWAVHQADRLDPLVESPPSILDEPEEAVRISED